MLSVLKMRTANEFTSVDTVPDTPCLLKVKTDIFETNLDDRLDLIPSSNNLIVKQEDDDFGQHEDQSISAEEDRDEDDLVSFEDSNYMANMEDESSGKLEKRKRKPVPMCIKCPVCGSPAPGHVHFGGQCCYSCRAFFRRTSLRPILSFKCRGGEGKCKVTSGTKSCILCRLKKCFEIGMNPSLIRGNKSQSDARRSARPTSVDFGASREQLEEDSANLQSKADDLHYQGLKLQYRASQLRRQAIISSQLHQPAAADTGSRDLSSMYRNRPVFGSNTYPNSVPVTTVVRHSSDANPPLMRQHHPYNSFTTKENLNPRYSSSWDSSSVESSQSYSGRPSPPFSSSVSPLMMSASVGGFSSPAGQPYSIRRSLSPNMIPSLSGSISSSYPFSRSLSEEEPRNVIVSPEPLDLSSPGGSPTQISHTQMTGMPRLFFRKI